MATEDVQKQITRIVNDHLGGSDHLPITLHVADKKTTAEYHIKGASWNYKSANWTKYKLHAEDLCNVTVMMAEFYTARNYPHLVVDEALKRVKQDSRLSALCPVPPADNRPIVSVSALSPHKLPVCRILRFVQAGISWRTAALQLDAHFATGPLSSSKQTSTFSTCL